MALENASPADPARLSRATAPPGLLGPRPEGPAGIVHLGLGNFHRAHQAVYTARALAHQPGPWGIHAFGSRSRTVVDGMRAQDLLYSVLQVDQEDRSAWVPGVHTAVDVAAEDPGAVVAAIAAPGTSMVTLTVTEHGYSLSARTGGLDLADPAVQHDLADRAAPTTAVGQVTAGLLRRWRDGTGPVSVLSCDNLSDNGHQLAGLVRTCAAEGPDPAPAEFLDWLAAEVTFPCSMVDRIVPATTDEHRRAAAEVLGVADPVTVPAEPFSMWAIEDAFAAGRPAWDAAGAILTDDVAGYELLKLRLLNGTHSLIAYLGCLTGAPTIPASVGQELVEEAARQVMREEYLPTVRVPADVDAEEYMAQLLARFSNHALGHRTTQVGTDGSQKLPQRIVGPAVHHVRAGRTPHLLCLTLAAWLACLAGRVCDDHGLLAQLADPRAEELRRLGAAADSPAEVVDRVLDETGIFPTELTELAAVRERTATLLATIERHGAEAATRDALQG